MKNSGPGASSAAWFDYDNDGRPTLSIAIMSTGLLATTFTAVIEDQACAAIVIPDDFHGQPPTLYHNNGDGLLPMSARLPVWASREATD